MTDTPQRIQLKRTKGWRMPPNTVKVDRSTEWGNPFRVGDPGTPNAAAAVGLFSASIFLCNHLRAMGSHHLAAALSDELGGVLRISTIQRDLRGKNLACWCPPGTPCHGDVLLSLANPAD